jgi:hypothetical protein
MVDDSKYVYEVWYVRWKRDVGKEIRQMIKRSKMIKHSKLIKEAYMYEVTAIHYWCWEGGGVREDNKWMGVRSVKFKKDHQASTIR